MVKLAPMRILLTGAAGFIGFHTAKALLSRGDAVVGLDSLYPYYDPALKQARLDILQATPNFTFVKADLANTASWGDLGTFDTIVHLGAQAGVRYSLTHPHQYGASNLTGFLNILEFARHQPNLRHFIYASSSSVYGNAGGLLALDNRCDAPVSLYAATKRSNELMAHAYAHLYGFPCTGLRFFTVYGPYGRPDMAYYSFTKALFENTSIKIYGDGQLSRDFTYIDDVVVGILASVDTPHTGYNLYNLGNHTPHTVLSLVETLEKLTGKTAIKEFVPRAPGDVDHTFADLSASTKRLGYNPTTQLADGLKKFVTWYKTFHSISA